MNLPAGEPWVSVVLNAATAASTAIGDMRTAMGSTHPPFLSVGSGRSAAASVLTVLVADDE